MTDWQSYVPGPRNVSGKRRLELAELEYAEKLRQRSQVEMLRERLRGLGVHDAVLGFKPDGSPITRPELGPDAVSTFADADALGLETAGTRAALESMRSSRAQDLTNVNNFLVDTNNPANEGKYLPNLPAGARPVFDENQNVIGARALDGSLQLLEDQTAATARGTKKVEMEFGPQIAAGEAAGRAAVALKYAGPTAEAAAAGTGRGASPFDLVTVDQGGTPLTTSRANVLQQGGVRGQGAVERETALLGARAGAARLSELQSTVDTGRASEKTIREALNVLPKAITGLGAGAVLDVNRALAKAGRTDANARVVATETYQALINRNVPAIAKQLGSGAGITDADRKFAQQIAAGDITVNKQTLGKLLNLQLQQIQHDRRRLEQMKGGGQSAAGAAPNRSAVEAEMRRRGLLR
jgi:hypothetical protein